MRALDRAAIEERLFPCICAGRERSAGDRPVIVVATQCIEAGADLDFDVLLTECASLDALRQRFGRLNRLGAIADAHGSIFVRKDLLKADDPIYGSALRDTWAFLNERSGLDFGIRAFGEVRRDDLDRLAAPRSRAPHLLPAHLDVWAQTSVHPEPEPEVALWLHGLDPVRPEVQIAWRADVSEALLSGAADGDGAAWTALLSRLELLPPTAVETLSVPIGAARRWLAGREAADFADVERPDPDDDQASDGRLAFVWKGDRSQVVEPSAIRPGDTLVVPACYGGLGPFAQEETGFGTWDPSSGMAVDDVAERAHLQAKGRRIVRLHPALVAGTAPADAGADGDLSEQTYCWLAAHPQLGQLATGSLAAFRRRFRVLRLAGFADEPAYAALVSKRREESEADEATTADDSSSFSGTAIALRSHLRGVGAMAGELARRIGLPEPIAADLELAGCFHDLGKIDPRFQLLLHGGNEFRAAAASEPLAKSAVPMSDRAARDLARERSRYPAGQRHELLSLALLDSEPALLARANDPDLVRHLVASHHGHCRPLAPIQLDPAPLRVEYQVDDLRVGASTATEYHRLDSGVGDRFWTLTRRYGWWGLAWLEMVLRLADHRRSEAEQRGTVE